MKTRDNAKARLAQRAREEKRRHIEEICQRHELKLERTECGTAWKVRDIEYGGPTCICADTLWRLEECLSMKGFR